MAHIDFSWESARNDLLSDLQFHDMHTTDALYLLQRRLTPKKAEQLYRALIQAGEIVQTVDGAGNVHCDLPTGSQANPQDFDGVPEMSRTYGQAHTRSAMGLPSVPSRSVVNTEPLQLPPPIFSQNPGVVTNEFTENPNIALDGTSLGSSMVFYTPPGNQTPTSGNSTNQISLPNPQPDTYEHSKKTENGEPLTSFSSPGYVGGMPTEQKYYTPKTTTPTESYATGANNVPTIAQAQAAPVVSGPPRSPGSLGMPDEDIASQADYSYAQPDPNATGAAAPLLGDLGGAFTPFPNEQQPGIVTQDDTSD